MRNRKPCYIAIYNCTTYCCKCMKIRKSEIYKIIIETRLYIKHVIIGLFVYFTISQNLPA